MTTEYRVIVAFGPYSVGHIVAPTGLFRQRLLQCRYIEEVPDVPTQPKPQARDTIHLPPRRQQNGIR